MEVSSNRGTLSHDPISMGFSIVNHLAIGVPPWPWKPPYDCAGLRQVETAKHH